MYLTCSEQLKGLSERVKEVGSSQSRLLFHHEGDGSSCHLYSDCHW